MPNIADFNSASSAATDREHDVQLGRLQALCRAVADNRDAASVSEILDRLIAYSEAHFMSEELLMRLNSHDDYADHVDDHGQMLDRLRQIAAEHAAGSSPLLAARSAEILGLVRAHIATRDQRFAERLRKGQ